MLFAFRTIWISGALDFVNQVIAGFNAVTGESALLCCTELCEQRTCDGDILLSYGMVFYPDI